MTPDRLHQPELDRQLSDAIRASRILCIAGLPGVGKSLILDRAAALASRQGRRVHLLRWDGARLAFDVEPYSERYPEVDDVTHPVIRRAVGIWARGAVERWSTTMRATDVLLAETPLLGNRLLELTIHEGDRAEAVLGSVATRFVVIVPSTEVREAITRARERDFAAARTVNDQVSAAPRVIAAQWTELVEAARGLGVTVTDRTGYDPRVYWGVYERILRHRRCERLSVNALLDTTKLWNGSFDEILPTVGQVHAAFDRLAQTPVCEVIEQVNGWAGRV